MTTATTGATTTGAVGTAHTRVEGRDMPPTLPAADTSSSGT